LGELTALPRPLAGLRAEPPGRGRGKVRDDQKLDKRMLQVSLPADFTGSLDRVIGSGCLRTSHNADNVVIVYCVLQGSVATQIR